MKGNNNDENDLNDVFENPGQNQYVPNEDPYAPNENEDTRNVVQGNGFFV